MYNRVYNYLNDNSLLFRKQFGFRKGHSTDHALHNILIDKLNCCGIKNNGLKWFSSYLSNKKQFVQAGAIKTSSLDTICGVLQGSILGPLLFIIYVMIYVVYLKYLSP